MFEITRYVKEQHLPRGERLTFYTIFIELLESAKQGTYRFGQLLLYDFFLLL